METQKLSFEDFKNIVVERLGCEPEQVTMDASLQEDLNADSLDLVELIYAFEENTGLEIPDEDAEKITTARPPAGRSRRATAWGRLGWTYRRVPAHRESLCRRA